MITKVAPDVSKDQFFLTDQSVLARIASFADLSDKDVVLEIGAGPGNLTRLLAQQAGKVIALEIDERFRADLENLPENVEVVFADAHKYVSQGGKFWKTKPYNKIVANIPYNLAEWLLHNIAFVYLDKVILLVPVKFAHKIEDMAVFGSFFQVKVLCDVDRHKFTPVPRTNSAVIELVRLPDAVKTKNVGLFLRQYIYQKEDWKVKNSLREGLITYYRKVLDKKLSKNDARKLIEANALPQNLLELPPDNKEVYRLVGEFTI